MNAVTRIRVALWIDILTAIFTGAAFAFACVALVIVSGVWP